MTIPTSSTATARIAAGIAASDPARRTAEAQARSWRYDPTMERLAALRDQPERWAAVAPITRLSLGAYTSAKAAAAATGTDTSAPTATP